MESLDWTVQEAVLVFKLGSKREREEPGGRSFKTYILQLTQRRGRKEHDDEHNVEPRKTETRS